MKISPKKPRPRLSINVVLEGEMLSQFLEYKRDEIIKANAQAITKLAGERLRQIVAEKNNGNNGKGAK